MAVSAAIYPDEASALDAFGRIDRELVETNCSVFRMTDPERENWIVVVVGEIEEVASVDLGGKPYSIHEGEARALEARRRETQKDGIAYQRGHYEQGARIADDGQLIVAHPPLYDDSLACDFCGSKEVKWSFPCETFDVQDPGMTHRMVDDWAACDGCKVDIEASNWTGVFERWCKSSPTAAMFGTNLRPEAREALHQLWKEFARHRTGDPIPE